MSLKPWREIARPHKDVLQGTFKQSEFAADISQVVAGTAPPEYQDAQAFFSRTFITEGMRLLLISVARRLTGQGGDPVIQIQTAFGGGKTHTMLAVMHLALRKVSTDKMEGIPPLLDEAGIPDLPGARVAVIDGIKLAPSQPQHHGDITANTLWGELAWQLLGDEGYAMVAQSDADGTSPGKEVLHRLIQRSAPCVILIDELLAFMRQLELGKQFKAGTFDSNISFIQALTEAMKLVPNAMLLASLPESELEVGGTMGQRVLNALEKYFARVEPVIEKEVDGPRSEPANIDGHDTRFGAVQAARRAMRTIFLGSAPTVSKQMVKGLLVERILLGCAQPGQTVEVFEDVLRRLHDRLQYLYFDDNRFWLDTRPNLRREMESRKSRIDTREKLIPLLKTLAGKMFGRNHSFAGVHIFTASVDIPDDFGSGPRLVVLPPEPLCAFTKGDGNNACTAAEKILRNRGEQPRQKQNRLIFVAADFDFLGRLKDHARTFIAWTDILSDIDNGKLNLDLFQINQAKQQREGSERSLNQILKETYKWILCPVEDIVQGKPKLVWESVQVPTSAKNLSLEIENKLKEEDWLITRWSPIHLNNLLKQWYFKDGNTEVSAVRVWQDSCCYLYLPRLLNEEVFRDALEKGLETEEFFGFAMGKDGETFLGFDFGQGGSVNLDGAALIIECETAAAHQSKVEAEKKSPAVPGKTDSGKGSAISEQLGGKDIDGKKTPEDLWPDGIIPPPASTVKKQFYGTLNLDPVKAKMNFSTIVDEVVQQFTIKLNVDVRITVEVQVKSQDGFDEALQRSVKENCSVLKFSSAEFEEEQ